jgi:D-serine deaminase-like pyridoxal phosphate-dependent protein
MKLSEAETPRLLLDPRRLQRNIDAMAARCEKLGVTLRPHLKTPKSLQVANLAIPDKTAPITVSTLKEAEYFAQGGYTDILCAAASTPLKIGRAAKIQKDTGAQIILVTDSVELVQEADARAREAGAEFAFLLEIDCGEHRSGIQTASDDLQAVAAALNGARNISLAGVLTHAGHSYGYSKPDHIADVAEAERSAAVTSAQTLRDAGHACAIVSVGSTPTVLHAAQLEGVTEVRAGVYLFQDLAQYSKGICRLDDIAVTVLATVIGHNRAGKALVLDAGALALSKDISANAFLPDARYGYVCDALTVEHFNGLSVRDVYQEHGMVPVPDESWFTRLPIGSQVRVMPNHTCITCAAYDAYDVVKNGEIVDQWPRINGW